MKRLFSSARQLAGPASKWVRRPFIPVVAAVAVCALVQGALPLSAAADPPLVVPGNEIIRTRFGAPFHFPLGPQDTRFPDEPNAVRQGVQNYTDTNAAPPSNSKAWSVENYSGLIVHRNGSTAYPTVGGRVCALIGLPAHKYYKEDGVRQKGRSEFSYGFSQYTKPSEIGDVGTICRYKVDVFLRDSFSGGLTPLSGSPAYPVADIIQVLQVGTAAADGGLGKGKGGQSLAWGVENTDPSSTGVKQYQLKLTNQNVVSDQWIIEANKWYTIETIVYWNSLNAPGYTVPKGTNGKGGSEKGYIRARVYQSGTTPPTWSLFANRNTVLKNEGSSDGQTPANTKFVFKFGQYAGNYTSWGAVAQPIDRNLHVAEAASYK